MIELRVCNIEESLTLRKWATHIISLLDPKLEGDTRYISGKKNHFIRYFDDICIPTPNFREPTIEVCREILEFAKEIPDNAKVLVHCHAGVSRSTATAIALLSMWGMEPTEAVKYFEKHRPYMFPNMKMAMFFDEILGMNDKLSDAIYTYNVNQNENSEYRLFIPVVKSLDSCFIEKS